MRRLQQLLGIAPTHPFRKFNLAFLAAILFVLLLTPILWATDAADSTVTMLWLLALAAVIVYVMLLLYGLGYARDVDHILAGQYLVRWTYSAGEWQHFTAEERARTRREAAATVVTGVAGGILAGIYFSATAHSTPAVVAGVGGAVLISLLVAFGTYLASNAILAETAADQRAMYITELGVYRPWGYLPISGFNLVLTSAAVAPGDPAELVLVSSYASRAGRQTRITRVPIPHGQEAEARAFIRTQLGST